MLKAHYSLIHIATEKVRDDLCKETKHSYHFTHGLIQTQIVVISQDLGLNYQLHTYICASWPRYAKYGIGCV